MAAGCSTIRAFIYGSLLTLLLSLLSCTGERQQRQLTEADALLEKRLKAVKQGYQSLHLPATLEAARILPILQAKDVALKAEAYQYLAMLHYERGLFKDSIRYYTTLAGSLLTKDAAVALRARQQICRAMQRYYEWSWLEMDMACALGLQLLERAKAPDGELSARLYLLQGIARKMYARNTIHPKRRRKQLLEAADLMQEAIRIYGNQRASRHALAYEELGIVYAWLPDRNHRVRSLVDSIEAVTCGGAGEYVRTERLLGYWHRRNGRADSARYYYEALLSRQTVPRNEYLSEAKFTLRENLREEEDFAAALSLNERVMREAGCCAGGAEGGEIAACIQWSGCVYDMVEQAVIYYQRYLRNGETTDLDHAYQLAQITLGQYDRALEQLNEEEAFNRLITLGDRLVTVALEITYAKLHHQPERKHYDALFRTMEYGKSYLLNKELAYLRAVEDDTTDQSIRDKLAVTTSRLKLLKGQYTRDEQRLDLRALEEAESLIQLRSELTPAFENIFARRPTLNPEFTISGVQQQLDSGQAVLEFAEAKDLIVVYIDRDTTMVYTVDTALLSLTRDFERMATGRGGAPGSVIVAARTIGDSLFGPVADLLSGKTDLLLAPSVSLSQFPFAALPSPKLEGDSLPDRYLIEDYSLRYLDSWRTERLNASRRRAYTASQRPRICIWTHPALGGYLGRLGRQLLERGAPQSKHYVDGDCTGEQLLGRSGEYDLLHLSVHARGDTINLNDNYLYLNHRDSLNGLQIGGRRLSARLVVLAACATARGVSHRREGTYSIRRSFHRAGVPDVVASLYDIPAAATAGILEEFYRGLLVGLSPERALAGAQRACLSGKLNRRWVGVEWWGGLVVG